MGLRLPIELVERLDRFARPLHDPLRRGGHRSQFIADLVEREVNALESQARARRARSRKGEA